MAMWTIQLDLITPYRYDLKYAITGEESQMNLVFQLLFIVLYSVLLKDLWGFIGTYPR